MSEIMEQGLNLQDISMGARGITGRIAAILQSEGYRRVQQVRGGPWGYVKK